MKTITMDWDTYQSELEKIEEIKEEMFDQGSLACEQRYHPLIAYLSNCIKTNNGVFTETVKKYLIELGEL